MVGNSVNDNRQLDSGVLDPDRHEAEAWVEGAVAHLREAGVHRDTIFNALKETMLRLLDGAACCRPIDAASVRSDLQCLWGLQERVNMRTAQCERALEAWRRDRDGSK